MPYRSPADAILLVGLCGFAALGPANAQGSGWRLLRTPNPNGEGYAVSVSHTSDMARSDLDLAGLMLLCRRPGSQSPDASADVAIVTLTPFPPSARPSVTIGSPGGEQRFEGHILPPGAEILLPPEAAALLSGPWQSIHLLTVKVAGQERSFGGVIPIDGIAEAFATLTANCSG
jgi:hypothetical protein